MARSMGGPLLCVGDLLNDLSEGDNEEEDVHITSSDSHSFSPTSQSLHADFERYYTELNVALTNSGHSWTGLTQKVCAALQTADKLVQSAHVDLQQLSEKVQALEEILRRGEIVCQSFKWGDNGRKGEV